MSGISGFANYGGICWSCRSPLVRAETTPCITFHEDALAWYVRALVPLVCLVCGAVHVDFALNKADTFKAEIVMFNELHKERRN